jgi:chromosome partitioning protein
VPHSRIIAVVNQKGGVGKTTTSVNLAASIAASERKTLLIDLDPQANATSAFGLAPVEQHVYDALSGDCVMKDVIHETELRDLQVIPAGRDLYGAEVELVSKMNRERQLERALADMRDDYDYILIDCPPSLGLLTLNALSAADAVVIPLQCEYYALEGLSALLNTIDQVRESVNPTLEVFGILRTMFDPRVNLSNEVSMQLIKHFDRKVFRTIVPRNIRLAEAPSFGRPILLHDRSSRGAIAYLALAGEILRREDARMAEAV